MDQLLFKKISVSFREFLNIKCLDSVMMMCVWFHPTERFPSVNNTEHTKAVQHDFEKNKLQLHRCMWYSNVGCMKYNKCFFIKSKRGKMMMKACAIVTDAMFYNNELTLDNL